MRHGIGAVLLFGIPETKDAVASGAYDEHGVVQEAVRAIKAVDRDLVVITDVCNCEYTDHGHCGILIDGEVANDPTLELLARTAVSQAAAWPAGVHPAPTTVNRAIKIADTPILPARMSTIATPRIRSARPY